MVFAIYSHPVFGTSSIRLDGRPPRMWEGHGWRFVSLETKGNER